VFELLEELRVNIPESELIDVYIDENSLSARTDELLIFGDGESWTVGFNGQLGSVTDSTLAFALYRFYKQN
jgi:hypothetical protein